MKILVLIKEVPVVSEIRIDRKTFTVDRAGAGKMMNPADRHAVEAALTLAGGAEDEVTALCMGPECCESILREAAEMGCKNAVRLTDPAFAGADTLVTARILASAVKKLGSFDGVFCGSNSIDGYTSQIPSKLGTLLGFGVLTGACKMNKTENGLEIERKAGSGYEKLSASFPLVCSVTEELNNPRGANIRAKMAAKKLLIVALDRAALDIPEDQLVSPSKVIALFPPQKPESHEMIRGKSAVEKADALADLLLEKHLV